MKKIILFSLMLVSILMIVSCALSPEEAENQAAQALEQLSDEELSQLEVETAQVGEGMAIAGQGYQIPSGASSQLQSAGRALQRVNRNLRTAVLQQERARRGTETIQAAGSSGLTMERGQDEPCSRATSPTLPYCRPGLFCVWDLYQDKTTCQGPYPGALCETGNPRAEYLSPTVNSDFCESIGLVCGFDGTLDYYVCESPNQPDGSVCHLDYECASGQCEWCNRDRQGPPRNYRTRDCPSDPVCVRTIE